jgi:hypothetical protein
MPTVEKLGIDPMVLFLPDPASSSKNSGAIRYDTPVTRLRGASAGLLAHFLEIIIKYANAKVTGSPYGKLLARGLMERYFNGEEIHRATMDSPPHTRAQWRETILRFCETHGPDAPFTVSDARWTHLMLRKKDSSSAVSCFNANPYRFRVEELERGRPDDLFLREPMHAQVIPASAGN